MATAMPPSLWTGSTWDRVCSALFGGDERAMLRWGRRYLAAYPDVQVSEFHLGSAFREIVGARNRSQWWRTAVELLEGRAVPGEVALASQVSEPAVAFAPVRRAETSSAASERARRLALFDAATERQRERQVASGGAAAKSGAGRGWTRSDLYD